MTTQTLTLNTLKSLEMAQRLPALATLLVLGAYLVAKFAERRRTRRHLINLDAHMLRDIGLSPDQARREADKHFWQR